jgi:hypothetical protein
LAENFDGLAKKLAVGKQRSDVLEDDSRLWEVRYVTNGAADVRDVVTHDLELSQIGKSGKCHCARLRDGSQIQQH